MCFMLKDKSLLEYTNLFSPNDYEKNDNNNKTFSIERKKVKMYCSKKRKFEKPTMSYIFLKALSPLVVFSKCDHEYEKLFIEEESYQILTFQGLNDDMEEYKKYI